MKNKLLLTKTQRLQRKGIPLQKTLIGSSTLRQDVVNLLHMPFLVEDE